jgi:hypothetical protein
VRFKVELVASVAKDQQRQDSNEDAYSLGATCLALADGASESYDSRTWARLITEAYVLDQEFGVAWVAYRVQTYLNSSDFASLSWSRQAAFERGSFSTLLGLQLPREGDDVDVLAIGDSLAVHVRDGSILTSFPFQHPAQFDARPRLLSTLATANGFVGESDFFSASSATWTTRPGDQILLVTDAVGHWLLSHEDALTALDAVTTGQEFEQMVVDRRLDGSMRLDDSTVLRIVVEREEPEQQE